MKRFSSNAHTLQWIYRWVGAPVCGLLTAFRVARDMFQGGQEAPLGRILFLKLAEQGSTVLAHEAVRRAA